MHFLWQNRDERHHDAHRPMMMDPSAHTPGSRSSTVLPDLLSQVTVFGCFPLQSNFLLIYFQFFFCFAIDLIPMLLLLLYLFV